MAAAAVGYCKQSGGKLSARTDLVQKISSIGTRGKHLQNCERDLQFAVKTFAKALKVKTIKGPCRMWDPGENAIVEVQLSFLDPVSLASAFWRLGPNVFRQIFFGNMTENEVMAYWENAAARCLWFQRSNESTWDPSKWKRLAPVSIYGDDVNNYRNTEAGNISILSWCSDLARGNGPFLRYMLLSLYSEYTASECTYSDMQDIS